MTRQPCPYLPLLAALAAAIPAVALAVPGLNIWPSKLDVSAPAGEIRTGVVAVQNQGVSTRTLRVMTVNCRMERDGSLSYFDGDDPRGCRSWIKTSSVEITINPRANQQLLYSVRVPKGASGSYVAAVLLADAARAVPEPREYRDLPGIIIFVTVPNTGQRAADLLGLSLRQEPGETGYAAELLVRNRGTVMLAPSGLVQAFSEDGSEKQRAPVNEGKELVLPGAERALIVPGLRLAAGTYKVTATVDYGALELLQGETTVFIRAGEVMHQQAGIGNAGEREPGRGEPVRSGPPPTGAKGGKASKEDIAELMRLGTSLYSSGDYAKALNVWQRVLKADPKNAAARKNLERTRQKLTALKGAKE